MKYFLFNHSGSLNHGCEAIVRGTLNIINNSDRESSFILSSFSPDSDNVIEGINICRFETRSLTKVETAIAAMDLRFRKSENYALRKMYSPVVEQAADCDICLSIGGDTYCYGDNHGIRILTEELKKSGKKVVLWGASIGSEDLTDEKLESLRIFDGIFARESQTFELLREKKANSNIFLYADPAFCMEREEMLLPNGFTKENTVGLNLSPLVEKYNPEITQAAKGFIEYVIENTTLNLLLIPHVVEDENSDYDYMLPFYEEFKKSGRIDIIPNNLNAKQYKGIISKLRFFIGARTHSTIAAYSSGVPTIAVGYSVKSRGIAKDLFRNEDYVLDVKNIGSSKALTDSLNALIENESEIKRTLMREIPVKLRSAMQMGEKLSEI